MAASASPPSRPFRLHSLPGGTAFERVFQAGRTTSNDLLVIRFAPNDLDITRWGFAVGRRTAPAVLRNRTRRRLRAIAAAAERPGPLDIVVIAKRPALTATPHALAASFAALLKRVARQSAP